MDFTDNALISHCVMGMSNVVSAIVEPVLMESALWQFV